jgi:hypothetical protein
VRLVNDKILPLDLFEGGLFTARDFERRQHDVELAWLHLPDIAGYDARIVRVRGVCMCAYCFA